MEKLPFFIHGKAITDQTAAANVEAEHRLRAIEPARLQVGVSAVQREGGPVEEVHAGNIDWFPANERHWHGASPTTVMVHVAVTESLDGKNTDWMEKVTDEEYLPR